MDTHHTYEHDIKGPFPPDILQPWSVVNVHAAVLQIFALLHIEGLPTNQHNEQDNAQRIYIHFWGMGVV